MSVDISQFEEGPSSHSHKHDDPPPFEEGVRWAKFVIANLKLVDGFWGKLKALRQFIRVLARRG